MILTLIIVSSLFHQSVVFCCLGNLALNKQVISTVDDPIYLAKIPNCGHYYSVPFRANQINWVVIDLSYEYFIESIVGVINNEAPLKFLTLNNFDKTTNPPDPSKHFNCQTPSVSDYVYTYDGYDYNLKKYDSDCRNWISFRYAAVWFLSSLPFSMTEVEVYGSLIGPTSTSPVEETTTTEIPVEVTTTAEIPVEITTTTEISEEMTTTTFKPEEMTTTTFKPQEITTTTLIPQEMTTTTETLIKMNMTTQGSSFTSEHITKSAEKPTTTSAIIDQPVISAAGAPCFYLPLFLMTLILLF